MTFKEFFQTLRESVSNKHVDFTKINIDKAVILLSVPMILELALESVFAIVDMFFVSRLGQNAIATVGLTEAFVTIIYSLAIGICTGATAIIARRVGEKKNAEAAKTAAQAILLACGVSFILSIIGIFFPDKILQFMGASEEVIAEGSSFARILIGGNIVIFLLFLNNGIFRAAGNATIAMRSLWIASGINIILCPILIHFYGLPGAAIATTVGRGFGVIYQFYFLFNGSEEIKLMKSYFKLSLETIKSVLTVAWPASLQYIVGSGSWIILTRLVAQTGGSSASAGCQIAFRNFVFFILPAWGLSNAAATLMGQNLGAGHVERAEKSVFITAKYSAYLMFFVSCFFLFFADIIIQVFTNEPAILQSGITSLRIIGAGFIFYGVGMVFTQAINGAGDTKTPTWLNVAVLWAFQIPLAYYLAEHTSLGPFGAIAAAPISQAVLTVFSYSLFKKGHWKTVKV